MQGTPTHFWGKLSQANGVVGAWHPLVAHCADVAACCEALLQRTLLADRLARLAGVKVLSEAQVHRLCVLAALHDAGKCNLGFWSKCVPLARNTSGHVRELFAALLRRSSVQAPIAAALGYDEIASWGATRLLGAAIAHHGAPMNFQGEDVPSPRPALWEPHGELRPIEGIAGLARSARAWFPRSAAFAEPFDEEAAPLQHAFNGLLTLADWLGSDSALFPFSGDLSEDRMPFAREAARRAVSRVGLDAALQREALGGVPGFEQLFPYPPRAAQRAVLELPLTRGGGLTVLESETGSGKTEAAIARFFALFAAGEVDGMYFALPTRTAAMQIHERVAEAVRRAFVDEDRRPPVILAVPGYIRVDEVSGQRKDAPALPPFGVLWPDDPKDQLRWRGWAAERPKRFLAGAVVVGTIDQVLLSTLPVKHAHLRAASLLRHLLVVDEVHASDAYMNRLLEEALERHASAGGHALLMSATLGAASRERFLAQGAPVELPSVEEAFARAYPSIEWVARGRRDGIAVGQAGSPKTVHVTPQPWMEEPDSVATAALEAAQRGARVLVLRNTVAAAVKTQLALEVLAGAASPLLFRCEEKPAPHHARYAREDRERLDQALESTFGKNRAQAGTGCVAVATQTVQQSLDLDADLLLTDLCPADVLLQRIGRLHRHPDRPRPEGFAEARALLLVPADRDLAVFIRTKGKARGPSGIGTVYPDLRVLDGTWTAAEELRSWEIPNRNRELVERTTHPAALHAIAAARGDRWLEHEASVTGANLAMKGQAATNVFRWDQPFGERGFSSEVDEVVKTRLGAGDRLAQFTRPEPSPFAGTIAAITVPAWLVADAGEEAAPEDVAVSDEGIRFRFGSRELVYDRLGLRRAAEKDPEEDDTDA